VISWALTLSAFCADFLPLLLRLLLLLWLPQPIAEKKRNSNISVGYSYSVTFKYTHSHIHSYFYIHTHTHTSIFLCPSSCIFFFLSCSRPLYGRILRCLCQSLSFCFPLSFLACLFMPLFAFAVFRQKFAARGRISSSLPLPSSHNNSRM